MSYEKTTWNTGDVITAEKLNNLEDGVASSGGGGVLIVNDEVGVLDKTWKEVYDVYSVGGTVIVKNSAMDTENIDSVSGMYKDVPHNTYGLFIAETTYEINTETGYPAVVG